MRERRVGLGDPYRLKPVSMGKVVPPHDLDKSLQLADSLEDEAIARDFRRFPGVEHVNPLDRRAVRPR